MVFFVDVAVHEAVDEEVVDGRSHYLHPLLGKPVQDVEVPEGVVFDVDFTHHAHFRKFLPGVDVGGEFSYRLPQQTLHATVVAGFNKR